MTSVLSFAFSLLSIISIANSNIIDLFDDEYTKGPCLHVKGQPKFNVNKMFGKWYGIKTHNWEDYHCLEDNLVSVTGRNLTVVMKYRTPSGEKVQQTLTAIADPEDPAVFDTYILQDDGVTRLGEVVLFYVNYHHCYALYICQNKAGKDSRKRHKAVVLILCRTPKPKLREIWPAVEAIFKHGLSQYRLSDIDRRHCKH